MRGSVDFMKISAPDAVILRVDFSWMFVLPVKMSSKSGSAKECFLFVYKKFDRSSRPVVVLHAALNKVSVLKFARLIHVGYDITAAKF